MEVNVFLLREDTIILEIIERYGGVEEINREAKETGKLETL
ncbi:MAG: hypothetical protein QXZ47_05490 [Candidatus Bathyarchaeia archaeon]